LLAPDLQEFQRRDAVASKVSVESFGGGVAGLAAVAHDNAPEAAPENQSGAQARRSAPDYDDIE
jgi:hypothetical protein